MLERWQLQVSNDKTTPKRRDITSIRLLDYSRGHKRYCLEWKRVIDLLLFCVVKRQERRACTTACFFTPRLSGYARA